MRYKLAILVLAGFMLSGCASYQWQKQGATTNQLNKDLYKCQTEAAKLFPTYMVTGQNELGLTETSTTNCSSSSSIRGSDSRTSDINCISTGLTTTDANAESREQATDQCMQARGWKFVRKP